MRIDADGGGQEAGGSSLSTCVLRSESVVSVRVVGGHLVAFLHHSGVKDEALILVGCGFDPWPGQTKDC